MIVTAYPLGSGHCLPTAQHHIESEIVAASPARFEKLIPKEGAEEKEKEHLNRLQSHIVQLMSFGMGM